ncbi:MAG: hypothetical protein RIM84_04220 [Alphaproteobacteria bacterium]
MARDQLLAVIGKCQAAALDGALWPAALAAIADVTGGVDTTLELRDQVAGAPVFFAHGARLPDDGVRNYLAHYAAVCPRIPYLDTLRPGQVGYDHDFISEAEMDHDEFYADFLARDGLRYFLAGALSGAHRIVAVQRAQAQGHATPDEIARLSALLPHVGQAVDLFLRLRTADEGERRLLRALEHMPGGVVLLADDGRVCHANARAEAIARAGDGLSIAAGRLRPEMTAARQALERYLRDGMGEGLASGGDLYVPRPSGRPPYALRLRRLASAAEDEDGALPALLVFIDEPGAGLPPSPARIAAALGLTQRQAELAAALYAGETLRQHAEARGIQLSTARYHLYQLMARLGLRRQGELIRLIAGLGTTP